MTRRRSPRLHPQIPAGMAVRRSPRLLSQTHTSEDGSGIALRRSPRLHPQIPVSAKGAGATCRRSSRLNPEICVGEEVSGVTYRRSPRLNPQLHTSEEGAGRRTTLLHPQVHSSEAGSGITRRRRRRGTSPAAPAALPDDDDMLREILLRLPPQPSSLPRASAVCKRWQRVTTDPRLLSSFSAHHRKPPLLGFFEPDCYDIVFTSIMDPPNRIPPVRFDTRRQIRSFRKAEVLGCRHGLVLLLADWFIV
ncbi:uncharacterized protein [Triticum aestivum]|uniref:uncharacterized protein isoform X2 n=1 Tax=Triticum aestivum TaxID=4565 RepID=UPI001D01787D|nr:uncharacterized protein LOC123064721 isoform X2 [Triticum aestivum]